MQEPEVIFEDESILVINKPGGMVVNRAASVKVETVQDWAEAKLKVKSQKSKVQVKSDQVLSNVNGQLSNVDIDWDEVNRQAFYDRAGIVHRLDKETSGVMVIAKTEDVYIELLRQFREREVQKTYVALVHGEMPQEEGIMEGEVGRLPWNRERFGVMAGGRSATTKYRVLKKLKVMSNVKGQLLNVGESFTFLELEPRTGRTHQIRIHLKAMNRPIVGDEFYAGRKTARNDRTWCPRLFLHAKSLELTHPVSKEKVKFEAELAGDLVSVLESLETVSPEV